MPFLDRLQRWADERPHDTAVVVAGQPADLGASCGTRAAGLVPDTPAVTVLSEENSLHFAAAFAAAVAGERQCAVLDPLVAAAAAGRDQGPDPRRRAVAAAGSARTRRRSGTGRRAPGHDVPDRPDVRHHVRPQGLHPLPAVLAGVLRRVDRVLRPRRGRQDPGARAPRGQPEPLRPGRMPVRRLGVPHPGRGSTSATPTPPSATTASPAWCWSPPCCGCSANGD